MSSTLHADSRLGIAKQTTDPWKLDRLRCVESARDNSELLSTIRQARTGTDGWNTLG